MGITRFRIEARGTDKDELGEEMSEAVGAIMKALRKDGDAGYWECTDEVISMEKKFGDPEHLRTEPTGYFNGRMVMKWQEISVTEPTNSRH